MNLHQISKINLSREVVDGEGAIWRYDPILFNGKYTPEYHLRAFEQIAGALRGCTEKCVISFVDFYAKIKRNLENLKIYELEADALEAFASRLAGLACENGMELATCAEAGNLSERAVVSAVV